MAGMKLCDSCGFDQIEERSLFCPNCFSDSLRVPHAGAPGHSATTERQEAPAPEPLVEEQFADSQDNQAGDQPPQESSPDVPHLPPMLASRFEVLSELTVDGGEAESIT